LPNPITGELLSEYEFENTPIQNLSTEMINCYRYASDMPGASSRFAIVGDLPATITLNSVAPFVTQYGNPQMYIYDENGNVVSQVTASSVASDGASATFPLPSGLGQNGYTIAVANQTGGGGTQSASYNLLSVAGSQTIAGNPFGVAVGAQTDTYEYRETCDRGETSGSTYFTFPVVSLYSANQVTVDGVAISVGANPTAVAAYNARPVVQTQDDSCDENRDEYSGLTQAVVANSGTNTVSILDIVNDAVLSNVTVGNQPVALVVNSSGSTAYVANYKDKTVTVVNLATDTPGATVAVGGNPTSVALTSTGILWVGGVGFLTEINTATMGVTATEMVSGKTIVALGYSDSVGQLVATTVDGSGNVYADEINPATVTAGGTYTPLASNTVSSLGTHLDTQTEADVRSFTGTLASESMINTNQVGAPPLVVQDGWAVVTATPTGFTITDITGHEVLISENTPSPVTAIAVDANLNVVHLTMLDSNTLLTVPLPGTGTN
jgi:YVTN family beta-propeller protein